MGADTLKNFLGGLAVVVGPLGNGETGGLHDGF